MRRLIRVILVGCFFVTQVMPVHAVVSAFTARQAAGQIAQEIDPETTSAAIQKFLNQVQDYIQSVQAEINKQKDISDVFPEKVGKEDLYVMTDEERANGEKNIEFLFSIYDGTVFEGGNLQANQKMRNEAKEYLILLLPSYFDSLSSTLREQSFQFLNNLIDPNACNFQGEKTPNKSACEATLKAADALGGIFGDLTGPQKNQAKLKALIEAGAKGPAAAAIIHLIMPFLLGDGNSGELSFERDFSAWNVAGVFALSGFFAAPVSEDVWARGKDSSYYRARGYGNYFNAWVDLGRELGFIAKQGKNERIKQSLDQAVGLLLNQKKGKQTLWDYVKAVENHKDTEGWANYADDYCDGAKIAEEKMSPPGSNQKNVQQSQTYSCEALFDPLYPFIIGVFSTGYAPEQFKEDNNRYLLAFLRRSYGRGMYNLESKTAAYMNNLIALGYYSFGGEVPTKEVNGQEQNYTCKNGASSSTLCQHSWPVFVTKGQGIRAIYSLPSSVHTVLAVEGIVKLGISPVRAINNPTKKIKLLQAGEPVSVYGGWRFIKQTAKLTQFESSQKWAKIEVEKAKKAVSYLQKKPKEEEKKKGEKEVGTVSVATKGTGLPIHIDPMKTSHLNMEMPSKSVEPTETNSTSQEEGLTEGNSRGGTPPKKTHLNDVEPVIEQAKMDEVWTGIVEPAHYNLLKRTAEDGIRTVARAFGLGIESYEMIGKALISRVKSGENFKDAVANLASLGIRVRKMTPWFMTGILYNEYEFPAQRRWEPTVAARVVWQLDLNTAQLMVGDENIRNIVYLLKEEGILNEEGVETLLSSTSSLVGNNPPSRGFQEGLRLLCRKNPNVEMAIRQFQSLVSQDEFLAEELLRSKTEVNLLGIYTDTKRFSQFLDFLHPYPTRNMALPEIWRKKFLQGIYRNQLAMTGSLEKSLARAMLNSPDLKFKTIWWKWLDVEPIVIVERDINLVERYTMAENLGLTEKFDLSKETIPLPFVKDPKGKIKSIDFKELSKNITGASHINGIKKLVFLVTRGEGEALSVKAHVTWGKFRQMPRGVTLPPTLHVYYEVVVWDKIQKKDFIAQITCSIPLRIDKKEKTKEVEDAIALAWREKGALRVGPYRGLFNPIDLTKVYRMHQVTW